MFNKLNNRSINYTTTFNTDQGKEVLKDLAKVCNAYGASYVTGDPMETARNEGRREVYNYIMKILEANQELLHRQYYQDVGREQLNFVLQQEKELYG